MNKKKPPKGPRYMYLLALGLGLVAFGPRPAYAEPISVQLSEKTTLVLPLQIVKATQLYDFKEGRGFPAMETVLLKRGDGELTFGAAPVLGSSVNVPFVGLQVKLSDVFFDTSDNDLRFGLWAGRRSDGDKHVLWGIKASVALW